LASMPDSRRLARGTDVRLVRPLLSMRRHEVEDYLESREVVARHDVMNDDARFARVRVRKELLPRAIDLVNPAAEDALARVAEAARVATRGLEREASRLLRKAGLGQAPPPPPPPPSGGAVSGRPPPRSGAGGRPRPPGGA